MCKKASQKLNTIAKIVGYMDIQKRRTIMKSFLESQFGYCRLVWKFHSRNLNNKINSMHERVLRITYGDKTSTFQQLLEKNNSGSIHHRNLKNFKIYNNLSPEIVRKYFRKELSHIIFVTIIVLQVAKLTLYTIALNHYLF